MKLCEWVNNKMHSKFQLYNDVVFLYISMSDQYIPFTWEPSFICGLSGDFYQLNTTTGPSLFGRSGYNVT